VSTPTAPLFVTCSSCDARYDVASREAGQRVLCRRCGKPITVPPAPAATDTKARSRTASERLLRAHGMACDRHARTLAVSVCERCGRPCCPRCLAAEPHAHLCSVCAEIAHVRPVLPVDWGVAPVLGNALRAWLSGLGPRILAYNALVIATVTTLFWYYAMVPLFVLKEHIETTADDGMRDFWVAVLRAVGLVIILSATALLGVLSSGGNATFLDGALRGERVTLGHAIYRCVHRAPSIAVAWGLVLLALMAPFFAVEIPFVLVAAAMGKSWISYVGLALYAPVALAILSSVVLAGPVAILEDRSGARAVGRAIELTRGHRGSIAALLLLFSLVWALCAAGTAFLGGRPQPIAVAVALLVSILIDVGWSALLVAAYHGLAAEKLDLVGRH
jgi:hypothetical protein